MMFGKRKIPIRAGSPFPQPTLDSDGKRRVFDKATFEGVHGDMLRELGFGPNDRANVIPDEAEFRRRVQRSLEMQDTRRTKIENDLLRDYGHNAIRPFFILAEPVFNSDLGQWLIRLMNLYPYDDWNIVYLPTDRQTQLAMGGLPLHPLQSIAPIDELMRKQIGSYYESYRQAKSKVDAIVQERGFAEAHELLDRFVKYVDDLPKIIVDHVSQKRPIIVELISEVQQKKS